MAIAKGIFQYDVKYTSRYKKIPPMMDEAIISSQGILIQLVIGKADIRDLSGRLLEKQNKNYTILPYEKSERTSYVLLSKFFGVDISRTTGRDICNHFLKADRKNEFVYSHILNELSFYFIRNKNSAIEGFVHLYRMLEFMSFCFPMMYSSISLDYKGSYDSLQKFFLGDKAGELKFFKRFINTLFEDESFIMNYTYEQYIDVDDVSKVDIELKKIIRPDCFNISDNIIEFKFCDVIDIFTTIRNRYFHMLVGKGKENFYDISYDKSKLFEGLNPAFLSWLIQIFTAIEQHGIKMFS